MSKRPFNDTDDEPERGGWPWAFILAVVLSAVTMASMGCMTWSLFSVAKSLKDIAATLSHGG